jgi:catechol 2,3-dioxygenase-like lactoylglutathione lyase family enzyme
VALQVDTVFVWVTDLEESLPWYQKIGFTAGDRYGTWQVLEVDGETRFALHQGIREEGPPTAVVSFRVDDLQATIDRLGEQSIRPIDQITDTGTTRFVTYRDPDGNEIQLLQR